MTNELLYLNIIDSHIHFQEMLNKDIPAYDILTDAFDKGFYAMLDIGIKVDDLTSRIKAAKQFERVLFAAGIYPGSSEEDPNIMTDKLKHEILKAGNSVKAIGECGLDFFHNYGTRKEQFELFEAQLDLANELNLPVVIHNRNADKETADILKKKKLSAGGIIHCFSSGKEEAFKFLDLDFVISFSGNITYKNSENIRNACAAIPSKSILLETDCPYLSPVPHRGKLNNPMNIIHTYQTAAEIRNTNIEDLKNSIIENFNKVLRIDLPRN